MLINVNYCLLLIITKSPVKWFTSPLLIYVFVNIVMEVVLKSKLH